VRAPPPPPVSDFFETQPLTVRGPDTGDESAAARDEIANALREGKPITSSDPILIAETVVALQAEMEEALLQGSIAKAREIQEAIERGKAFQLELLKKQEQEATLNEMRERRSRTVRSLENFERALKSQEERVDRHIASYVETKKQRQVRELDDFVKHWQSEAVRRRYNRTSVELRNLRKQEKVLCALRRLGDAEQVNKIAAQRERVEVDAAYRAMTKDYVEMRGRLEDKQEEQRSVIADAAKRKKEVFECMSDRMRKPWAARMKKLDMEEESARDPQRLWNRKHRFEGDPIEQCLGVSPVKSALPQLSPPRPLGNRVSVRPGKAF
jgi:hypothetical protein